MISCPLYKRGLFYLTYICGLTPEDYQLSFVNSSCDDTYVFSIDDVPLNKVQGL